MQCSYFLWDIKYINVLALVNRLLIIVGWAFNSVWQFTEINNHVLIKILLVFIWLNLTAAISVAYHVEESQFSDCADNEIYKQATNAIPW